jgi:hypothetical protein
MAGFVADEGSIKRFDCELDGSVARCDQPGSSAGAAMTGYTVDGQSGIVYYEQIPSNGTARPVPQPNTGERTSLHALRVRAEDAAGNVGAWSEALAWVLDPEPPLALIDSRQLFDGGTRRSTAANAVFYFGSFSGALFFECLVECLGIVSECDQPSRFLPCVSPVSACQRSSARQRLTRDGFQPLCSSSVFFIVTFAVRNEEPLQYRTTHAAVTRYYHQHTQHHQPQQQRQH